MFSCTLMVKTFSFTLIQVTELGNPKGKKAKEVPQHYEVCEPCKMHLDAGEEIPPPLLAKLVKWKLLDVKQKDLKRRETDKKVIDNFFYTVFVPSVTLCKVCKDYNLFCLLSRQL